MKNKNPTACDNLQSNSKDHALKEVPALFFPESASNKEAISIEDRRHRRPGVSHNKISRFRTLMIREKDGIGQGETRKGVRVKVRKTTVSLHPQESI